MSMDRSLKSKASLSRHRNVLSRAERIKILAEDERWTDDKSSVFGLPKVAHRKASVGAKKKKEKKAEGEAGATPAAPGAAPAAAAAPAAGKDAKGKDAKKK